ncbi:MAG: T9SS type A sorting domain-containing protein, partial [Fibrobacter sp.]|nr:T9SS type A sorting domain-containing protein [Fibrobacter sp.]
DTVVAGKVIDKAKNGTWRLDPAPAGEYSVNFTFTDGEESVTYKKIFSTPKQKNLVMHSWQTLSMYAFCQNGTDNCVSDKASVYWWDETNPVGDYWQYRKYSVKDKFDSTRGYWYGPVDNEPLVMNLKTPDSNAEIVWKLQNKYSGWNLVANPYGWYVKLPQQDGVRFAKWDSDASEYVPTDTLGPYEAVWVQTDKSRTLRIPLKAVIVLEDEKKSLSKSAASDDWNLRVVLSDNNGKRDSWNELAVGSAKSLSEPPAGMGDRVNLSIVEGKKRFAKSVKQNSDNLEWNLEASATTPRAGRLSFVGLERVLAKGLRVYATVGDEMFEVTNDKPLDVQLSPKSKKVSIRVTKGAVTANIAKNWLSGFRVNQTSNVLNVGFDAASELAGANVKVSIVGIDGCVVATNRGVANAGSNVVSMKKPKLGVYFVRVRVGSQSASKRIMVR